MLTILNVESYNYGTLPRQVPIIWKMEHESTAEINSLLTEISGIWRTSVIGVGGRSYRAVGRG